jgi:hypothetical protein
VIILRWISMSLKYTANICILHLQLYRVPTTKHYKVRDISIDSRAGQPTIYDYALQRCQVGGHGNTPGNLEGLKLRSFPVEGSGRISRRNRSLISHITDILSLFFKNRRLSCNVIRVPKTRYQRTCKKCTF